MDKNAQDAYKSAIETASKLHGEMNGTHVKQAAIQPLISEMEAKGFSGTRIYDTLSDIKIPEKLNANSIKIVTDRLQGLVDSSYGYEQHYANEALKNVKALKYSQWKELESIDQEYHFIQTVKNRAAGIAKPNQELIDDAASAIQRWASGNQTADDQTMLHAIKNGYGKIKGTGWEIPQEVMDVVNKNQRNADGVIYNMKMVNTSLSESEKELQREVFALNRRLSDIKIERGELSGREPEIQQLRNLLAEQNKLVKWRNDFGKYAIGALAGAGGAGYVVRKAIE